MSRSPKLFAALLLAAPALGQGPTLTSAETAAIDRWRAELFTDGHYLAAVRALEPTAFDAKGKPINNAPFQYWSQFEPMLSEAMPSVSRNATALLPDERLAPLRDVTLVDAIAEITRRARDTRVVFLNEDHRSPRHRAFALQVARALRPLGYRTLALETLLDETGNDAEAAALVRDGYPRRATGTYTLDPAYADFVRGALRLGYRPIAYDNAAPTVAGREQGEAETLLRRALAPGSTDKLLVYVGLAHATERAGGGASWAAARLKAMTGIDPLTIDQTWLAADPAGTPTEQGRRVLAGRVGDRSKVLMKNGQPFVWGGFAGFVDLQVVHPAEPDIAGRPGWLAGMGRKPVAVPKRLLPATGIRLVQAFLASEAMDAVPIDQVLVTAGRPAPALMLPPGRPVRYAVEDDTGTTPLHAARQ